MKAISPSVWVEVLFITILQKKNSASAVRGSGSPGRGMYVAAFAEMSFTCRCGPGTGIQRRSKAVLAVEEKLVGSG